MTPLEAFVEAIGALSNQQHYYGLLPSRRCITYLYLPETLTDIFNYLLSENDRGATDSSKSMPGIINGIIYNAHTT